MLKKLLYITSILAILTVASALFSLHTAETSGPGEDPLPEEIPETIADAPVEIFGRVEHLHDLIDLRTMFVEARAYPGAGFPLIEGGYTETNVHAHIRIRGITTPTACQTAESRQNRPHAYVERERQRWDAGMRYLWGLIGINKVIKIVNPKVVDGVVECDVKFYLGGAWHALDTAMIQDDYARTIIPGFRVEWGSELLDMIPIADLENPDIPR